MLSPADAVQQELEQVPGVQDIASTYHAGLPNLNLALREDRASDLGVSLAAVGTTMQTLLCLAYRHDDADGTGYEKCYLAD